MKSIHFNQVPDMRGKLTMRFTDMTAVDLRPKEVSRIHRKEMADRDDPYPPAEAELDAYLDSAEHLAIVAT